MKPIIPIALTALAVAALLLPLSLAQKSGASTNAPPLELQSSKAAKPVTPPARLPVYVLPEVIVVNVGRTTFSFVEQHHINELAKKFPAFRVTNLVIYADGL